MLLPVRSHRAVHAERSGSALMLALLVLLVLIAITAQLNFGVNNEERVTKNDVTLTAMDLAIESAMLEVIDQLKTDGEAAASGDEPAAGGAGGAGAPGGTPPSGTAPGDSAGAGAGGAGAQQSEPVDSHEDSWAKPQRTQINDIELRILVQDEDSKLNLLGMLTANEEEGEKVFRRVVTVLDWCREGTSEDIDSADARLMAEAIREHLKKRDNSVSPKPRLLSDDEEKPEQGLPLSLAEFAALEPFNPSMFRDYRDENGEVVHSIGSFLTVWTALKTGTSGLANAGGASAAGGTQGGTDAGGNSTGTGSNGGTGNQGSSGSSTPGDDDSGSNPGQGSSAQGSGIQGGSTPGGTDPGQTGAPGAAGQAGSADKFGIAVNVNTAPPAVLKSLMDDRDVPPRWWDEVIEYRNLEEEKDPAAESEDEPDPVYDEYGREVIVRRVFDSLEELNEVNGTDRLDPLKRAELLRLLTTQSQVFSVYITARKVTARGGGFNTASRQPEPGEQEDLAGTGLLRTVHAVFWRTQSQDETMLVPIVRWEVLDYSPFEILDYPDDDR